MELTQNIKNPSLVPNWFIYSGDKVAGIHDANGHEYQFVGASEKGEDGKTPILYISADDCRWYADYRDGRGPILVSQSPAASGLVGPQGETGLSGDSVKVDSIVNENGGTTVTLAWGENFEETSSFFVPSGLSGAGATYSFDGTTLSGDGSTTDIGVNTTASMNFINSSAKSATYADQYIIEGKYYSISQEFNNKLDKPDITQPELNQKYLVYSTLTGDDQPKGWTDILDKVYSKSEADGTFIKKNLDNTLSGDGSSENNKLGLNTANIDPNKQYAWTTEGWEEVAAQSNLSAGTDLKIVDSIVQVNTNGIANSAGSAFVEGINTIASGIASHAAGKNTSAYSDYSFVEGYQNTDYLITGLIGANHTEGAYNQVSGVYSHIEGHANTLIGYGVHMEGGYNIFESHNLTADKSDPIGRWNIWGQSIEGMANATTAEPTSGTPGQSDFGYVHSGILKVIGNGTRTKTDESDPSTEVITRSDALILYRDGSMWVQGPITANGIELGAEPDLSDYIPYSAISLPIGTNNDVTNYSMGIGYNNTANYGDVNTDQQVQYGSLAFGYQNSASKMSFAAGNENKALHVGFAVGYHCSATEHAVAMNNNCSANNYSFAEGNNSKSNTYSFAEGNNSIANIYSFAGGKNCSANDYSFAYGDTNLANGKSVAYGHSNIAYNYSYLFGRGLEYSGASTADYNIGAFVIGGWNATTSMGTYAASPLFIIGNGGSTRSDAFVVYRNGAIKAGSDTTAKESNSVAFGSLSQASGNCAFVAGTWCYAIGQGAHAEGNSCGTTGYGNHIQGSFNVFESTGDAYNGPANTPVFVGGTLNATTAQNYSDHGGYLQVMGNGTYQSQGTGTRSDAYILYRDGTVSAKQFQNADGTDTINGTTYSFTGVDNIEILPNAATANTANFPNDNVLRFILES